MTLSDVGALLQTTGMPVAYSAFKGGEELPAIVYWESRSNNFGADDKVYKRVDHVVIELYTEHRDLTAEEAVETALQDFFWDKTILYLDTEKCYQIIYEIEV